MHKFIPACHLENVDALNTATQKKNPANQNELLKCRRAKAGREDDKWTVVSHDSRGTYSGPQRTTIQRPSYFNRPKKSTILKRLTGLLTHYSAHKGAHSCVTV